MLYPNLTKLAGVAISNDEEEKQKNKNKERRHRIPKWLWPIMGTSAGAFGASRGIGSRKMFEAVERGVELSDIKSFPLAAHETVLSRYQDVVGRGARVRPFGIKPGPLLTRARQDPDIMRLLGATSHLIRTPAAAMEGAEHYNQFSRGPIPSYWHQLEFGRGRGAPITTPGALAAIDDPVMQAAHWGGNKPKNYLEFMEPWIRETANDFWREQTGSEGTMPPQEIADTWIPADKQMGFFKHLYDKLPEFAQQERIHQETTQPAISKLITQMDHYSKFMRYLLQTRKALQATGITAGGAAVGGLLADYLYRLRNTQKGDDKPHTWDDLLVPAAGAGAGGLLSFFVGTPYGRAILQRGIRRGLQSI